MIDGVGDRATFRELSQSPRRTYGPITVRFLDDGSDPPRVAYAIGRHLGGAVVRNRIRRRIAGQLRGANAVRLPAGTYLVSPRSSAETCSATRLREALEAAATQIDSLTRTERP